MFKSIKWKIVIYFVLITILVQTVCSVVAMLGIASHYRNDFKKDMENVFTGEVIENLTEKANLSAAPVDITSDQLVFEENDTYGLSKLIEVMNSYTTDLKISSSRFYSILDSEGKFVHSSSEHDGEHTEAILKALKGTPDGETSIVAAYMDYALPLMNGAKVKYVVYIRDMCDNRAAAVGQLFDVLLCTLLISAVIALLIGLVFASDITTPLRELTEKARLLTEGDINALEESDIKDEIGEMTNTLILLAKKGEEATVKANEEKHKIETILQNMNDGILAFDTNGKLIHFNNEAQKLLNRKYLDDITFDRFFKELNANITLGDILYVKPASETERMIKVEEQFLTLGFATFMLENKVGGIIVIIHDITKQERLEKSRREFVSNVSHELRTPLTTIKSYAEMLSDTPDADVELRTRFLGTITSEADRMTRMISDFLTLSQLDENQSYVKQIDEIDVRALVDNIIERNIFTAKKKNIELVHRRINETPKIMGYRDGLDRVITNIVTNALKYTRDGGTITVYTSKVYKDIQIKIADTGIGIPEDQLPKIFDRFFRVDKARSRDRGGSGLGLAIAKQTMEKFFNGKIKITSELNVGTEVTITIPVEV